MGQESLFGYLVTRFSNQPEDLATESLNYIISRSDIAKQALLDYLSQGIANKIDDNLTFQTQVTGIDKARPDLVGVDDEGRQILIIESKFWAGLTSNQPVAYLERLPQQVSSILLFLAPAMRLETLWPELLNRCKNKNIAIEQHKRISDELIIGRIDVNRVLAIASWRSVLSAILQALNAARELDTASDVMQLQGLCDRMDSEAFLPIKSEELASINGRRILQYSHLIGDLTRLLKKEGLVSTEGLQVSHGLGWYGQYLKLQGFAGLLQFNSLYWSKLRETPLWLNLRGRNWENAYSEEVRERLLRLEQEKPSRLLRDEYWCVIPLYLPIGVERNQVIEALLAQIREVAFYLGQES